MNSTHASLFIWRVTSGDASTDKTIDVTYANWCSGQPDPGIKEACMALSSDSSFEERDYPCGAFTWHDYPCSDAYYFVCEVDE